MEEDWNVNPLFVKIQTQQLDLYAKIILNRWTVLLPVKSSFSRVTKQLITTHVLIKENETVTGPKKEFANLDGTTIDIESGWISIRGSQHRSKILFDEVFYNENMQSFKIIVYVSAIFAC